MKKFMILLVFILGLCLSTGFAMAKQLSINGSTTVLPIAQEVAEAYMKENPGINISIAGTGSGNGIKAVIDGMTDIGMSSRWIKEGEVQNAFDNGIYAVPFAIALDAIIPVVHPDNPVGELSLEQLKSIYNGNTTNWKDVGGPDRPIVSISRDSSSGTYGVWVDVVLKGDRVSPRTQLLPSNGAIVQAVSGNRNAIGYVGIGYLSESLKPIILDGIEPSYENAASGAFPVSRTLWLFTDNWPKGETLKFMNYMLHPQKGQPLVKKTGYVPLY
jgi:phosphate transport system substrate-binding protein